MTGVELGLGILAGVIALLLGVSVITAAVTKANSKEINNMHNVYLGRLANSDASIQSAMKYLKLTNGIRQQMNGDKEVNGRNTSRQSEL